MKTRTRDILFRLLPVTIPLIFFGAIYTGSYCTATAAARRSAYSATSTSTPPDESAGEITSASCLSRNVDGISELTSAAQCVLIPAWSWMLRREALGTEELDHKLVERWKFDVIWTATWSTQGAYWKTDDGWEASYIREWNWTVYRRLENNNWRFTVETSSFRATCQTIPLRSTIGIAESD